jgi:hypothetical protein
MEPTHASSNTLTYCKELTVFKIRKVILYINSLCGDDG